MNPYLIFNGNCHKAVEFYKKCLGGTLFVMTYGQAPGANVEPKYKNWVIHARLSNKSFVLMASDTRPGLPVKQGDNFFISMNFKSIKAIEKTFKALSPKAEIKMPLQETFFAERFGMLTDQFGVNWMFNMEKGKKGK